MTTDAALDGNEGLQVEINDNNSIYVVDDTPQTETRYRARFAFDPNAIQMAEGDSLYIFTGYSDALIDVLRVEFRLFNEIYQVRGAVRNDANGWLTTGWIDLSDQPHLIELSWRAASTGESDGSLTLWVDEELVANLAQIDNDGRQIDEVRLGALGAVSNVNTGIRGILYLDAFESHRQTYIGPVATPTSVP